VLLIVLSSALLTDVKARITQLFTSPASVRSLLTQIHFPTCALLARSASRVAETRTRFARKVDKPVGGTWRRRMMGEKVLGIISGGGKCSNHVISQCN
jgi:hypothetical protein